MSRITRIAPSKSRFGPGETVGLRLWFEGEPRPVQIRIFHLGRLVLEREFVADGLYPGDEGEFIASIPAEYIVSDEDVRSGFVTARWVCVDTRGDEGGHQASTAIQIGQPGDGPIRYGFASDFSVGAEVHCPISALTDYNISHVQFYDWMYRHEDLISDDDIYRDALDREVDGRVVRDKIHAAAERSIRSLAYGAIYGASVPFYRDHREWALYRRDGNPHTLGEFLAIMNVGRSSPWREYIVGQYRKAVAEFGFHGIHLDTYGFPKRALSWDGRLVSIDEEVVSFVEDTRKGLAAEMSGGSPTLIFNAVNNWPIREVAQSAVDAPYVEVWPPNDRYRDLVRIAHQARMMKPEPPILAAYLESFKAVPSDAGENSEQATGAVASLLYATAVIHTAGATHLVMGENHGVLCDPYYVNHGTLPSWTRARVARYYSFAAAYGALLAGPDCTDITLDHAHGPDDEVRFIAGNISAFPEPGRVWGCVIESEHYYVISLVNLTELESDRWNAPHPFPQSAVPGPKVVLTVAESLPIAYTAAPEDPMPSEIEATPITVPRGPAYEVEVPPVYLWRLLWVRKDLSTDS